MYVYTGAGGSRGRQGVEPGLTFLSSTVHGTQRWKQSNCLSGELAKQMMALLRKGDLCHYKNEGGDELQMDGYGPPFV